MKASIGGIFNLFLLTVFIIVISSLLLFNVSYAKSFRVKDKIITTYEQYEGVCGPNTSCQAEIRSYEERLGYRVTNDMHADAAKQETCYQDLGYCEIRQIAANTKPGQRAYTYRIRTEVLVRFPLVDEILGLGKFKISGTTKAIVVN